MDNASNKSGEESQAAVPGENPNEIPINKPQSPPKKKGAETDKRLAALIDAGADKHSGWNDVIEAHERSQTVISLLDNSVNRALRTQEYQYLMAYNIYVKNKESQLRTLIEDFRSNKDSKNKDKDKRIETLEITI